MDGTFNLTLEMTGKSTLPGRMLGIKERPVKYIFDVMRIRLEKNYPREQVHGAMEDARPPLERMETNPGSHGVNR